MFILWSRLFDKILASFYCTIYVYFLSLTNHFSILKFSFIFVLKLDYINPMPIPQSMKKFSFIIISTSKNFFSFTNRSIVLIKSTIIFITIIEKNFIIFEFLNINLKFETTSFKSWMTLGWVLSIIIFLWFNVEKTLLFFFVISQRLQIIYSLCKSYSIFSKFWAHIAVFRQP